MSADLNSMTGFATSEGEVGSKRFRIEARTLNHRFLDIKVRVPKEFNLVELPIRNLVQDKFSRGSIDIKIERVADSSDNSGEFETNFSAAAHYYECLQKLQKAFGIQDEIKTSDILNFPDVITKTKSYILSPDREIEAKELWLALHPTIEEALDSVAGMRIAEGKALREVLKTSLSDIRQCLAEINLRRASWVEAYREKLAQRVSTAFASFPVDNLDTQAVLESRISQELALILDRTDIQEEVDRLENHVNHFETVLLKGGQIGRKLEFILQEMHREVNTLGNKAQDFSISEHVVQAKVKLEQIREQIMNIE